MWLKRVISIALLSFLVASSGCNNVEWDGPSAALFIKGPKVSARHIKEGENQGNEYLSRNSGIFGPSVLPMVGPRNSN